MNVLLVDDHPLILSALTALIESLGQHVRVVGVDSAERAWRRLNTRERFDLVLLDLDLGDADGFDMLVELRKAHPELPVVMVSATDRPADMIRAIDLGAMGYVTKRSSHAELYEALATVMSGAVYIPPGLLGLLNAPAPPQGVVPNPAFVAAAQALAEHVRPDPDDVPPTFEDLGLTPRQTDVLARLPQGMPNKVIAREMGLSVETVKDHVAAVLRALGVSTRTQAVLAVSRLTRGRHGVPGWRAPMTH